MKEGKNLLLLLSVLIFTLSSAAYADDWTAGENQDEEEAILVGRISYIEGTLLRYVPEEDDWAAIVKDTPFGAGDALYSDKDAKAEFILPNNTWVRIGGDTQIQFIVLKRDITEIDVASSVARFYNRSSDALIRAVTPFGYVIAPEGTSFEINVGNESVEVEALEGRIFFVDETTKTRYEVIAGSSSIVANTRRVTSGDGYEDFRWDAWNMKRDRLWANRLGIKRESVKHLPVWLYNDAYALEAHGLWGRVYYDGAYRYFWRPAHVRVGWAPFTFGRWTMWHGDNTWIPYEPFGYVTHHYGHWVFLDGFWYWAPPAVRIRAHARRPWIHTGFAWYPGKVAWINFGVYLGWVPLAPGEPYYCNRRWGPRAIVAKDVHPSRTHLHINRYRNSNRAVIIRRNNFYGAGDYRNISIQYKNHARFSERYHVAPVINDKMIRNAAGIKKHHLFSNSPLVRKPSRAVVRRIRKNEYFVTQHANLSADQIRRNFKENRLGSISKDNLKKKAIGKHKRMASNQVVRRASQGGFKREKLEGGKETTGRNPAPDKKRTGRLRRKASASPASQQAMNRTGQRPASPEMQLGKKREPPARSEKRSFQEGRVYQKESREGADGAGRKILQLSVRDAAGSEGTRFREGSTKREGRVSPGFPVGKMIRRDGQTGWSGWTKKNREVFPARSPRRDTFRVNSRGRGRGLK